VWAELPLELAPLPPPPELDPQAPTSTMASTPTVAVRRALEDQWDMVHCGIHRQ